MASPRWGSLVSQELLRLAPLLAVSCAAPPAPPPTVAPPPTATGQACTTQCMATRDACVDACAASQRQCEMRARMQDDFDSSLYGSTWRGGPFAGYGTSLGTSSAFGGGLRGFQLCQPTACENSCAEHLYACYTECGGRVKRETRCVDHCPPRPAR